MKVAVDMLEPVREPYLRVYRQHLIRMLLRPGSIEVGRRRSAMRRVTYSGGEVGLCCPSSCIRQESADRNSFEGHVQRFHASPDLAGIAGGRLGDRRIGWRCRPAGTEANHFNCQDEEARNLTTSAQRRH